MVKKSPETKTHKIVRISILSIVGLVILGGLIYVLIVRPLEIKNEKNNFLKAQASIEDLYDKVVAKIGKPDQVKKSQSCSYASRVFVSGPRSCDISIRQLYKPKSTSDANKLLDKISTQIVKSKLKKIFGDDANKFISTSAKSQTFSQDFINIDKISCDISYTYPSGYSRSKKTKNLEIELSCGGPAKAEHFPVK